MHTIAKIRRTGRRHHPLTRTDEQRIAELIEQGHSREDAERLARTAFGDRARVAAETGFVLRSEVRLVGFDDTDPLSFDEAPARAVRGRP